MEKKPASGKYALVWKFMKGSRTMLVLCVLMAGVMALADMISPQIIRTAIDYVIPKEADVTKCSAVVTDLVNRAGGFDYLRDNLWVMALAIVAVALVKVLSQYGYTIFNTRASETMTKTMRDSLYAHIQKLPFNWHMKNHTGDIIQRCTSDIETVRGFVARQMTGLVRTVILVLMAAAFMLSMNVTLALVAIVPMPFIVWYSVHFHNSVGEKFMKCDESEGRLSAMVQENLTGVRVVRAFGRERYERDRFEKFNGEYTGLWVGMGKLLARFWSVMDVITGLQIMLIVVLGAVMCINNENMSSGEYIAFIAYNASLIWPIRELGRVISEMSRVGVAVERIRYIVDSDIEHDRPEASDHDMTGDIRFDHVSFAYEGCPEILHDISFEMKAGTTLGILGGTGSGKSTLMLLLDRLYDLPDDAEGSITVGGVDIRDIKRECVRRNIGMVLQEPFLFSRTLKENLMITNDDLTMESIRDAARSACLDETIEGFTKGYETFVGERGVTLSGGQKQRAAIARTLTQNTPIMIFDDSLSAVDTETDAKIRKALQARFGSASIILISHRITTLSKADKVIVLDKGAVAEMGTPQELSHAGGLYQRICEIQSMHGEEVSA